MFSKGLPRSTPSEQGVSAKGIQSFLNAIEKDAEEMESQELHSFMLLRHGYVIAEGWWSPYGENLSHMLFSLSKSFTSTAIGFAVQEGILSVEDLVIDIFKEDLPEVISDGLGAMKIKHLLSMSTGHGNDTMDGLVTEPNGNWVRGFLSQPVDYTPGTHFLYNTGATYMLSAILQKKTGIKLVDFLMPRLFEPLGIENPVWQTCPRGINTGGFGLNIKTEDIAKFGQLYLQKGIWEGKQIISETWIEEATKKHISNSNEDNKAGDWGQGYGYQFWRCRNNAYRGDGAFGQYCIVMPEQDAVIAITGAVQDMQIPVNHIFEHLLPAMSEKNLIGSIVEDEELNKRLTELKIITKKPVDKQISHGIVKDKVSFVLQENELKFKEMSIIKEKHGYGLGIKLDKGELNFNCGTRLWVENIINISDILGDMPGKPGYPANIMGEAHRVDEKTIIFTLRFVETPFYYTIEAEIEEDKVKIAFKINIGFDNPESIVITGLSNKHMIA